MGFSRCAACCEITGCLNDRRREISRPGGREHTHASAAWSISLRLVDRSRGGGLVAMATPQTEPPNASRHSEWRCLPPTRKKNMATRNDVRRVGISDGVAMAPRMRCGPPGYVA